MRTGRAAEKSSVGTMLGRELEEAYRATVRRLRTFLEAVLSPEQALRLATPSERPSKRGGVKSVLRRWEHDLLGAGHRNGTALRRAEAALASILTDEQRRTLRAFASLSNRQHDILTYIGDNDLHGGCRFAEVPKADEFIVWVDAQRYEVMQVNSGVFGEEIDELVAALKKLGKADLRGLIPLYYDGLPPGTGSDE